MLFWPPKALPPSPFLPHALLCPPFSFPTTYHAPSFSISLPPPLIHNKPRAFFLPPLSTTNHAPSHVRVAAKKKETLPKLSFIWFYATTKKRAGWMIIKNWLMMMLMIWREWQNGESQWILVLFTYIYLKKLTATTNRKKNCWFSI